MGVLCLLDSDVSFVFLMVGLPLQLTWPEGRLCHGPSFVLPALESSAVSAQPDLLTASLLIKQTLSWRVFSKRSLDTRHQALVNSVTPQNASLRSLEITLPF